MRYFLCVEITAAYLDHQTSLADLLWKKVVNYSEVDFTV